MFLRPASLFLTRFTFRGFGLLGVSRRRCLAFVVIAAHLRFDTCAQHISKCVSSLSPFHGELCIETRRCRTKDN